MQLNFSGDWGQANFHRVCSWLCQEVCDRAAPGSQVAIRNSCGGADAVRLVAGGDVDFGIMTPAAFARMAVQGSGLFEGQPLPRLRAIGVLPQRDRLVLAIDAKYGVRTYAELRALAPKIDVVASTNDGNNFIGYATARMLEAADLPRERIESWGGKFITYQRPEQCIAIARAGQADAVIQEAIMTPWWRELMLERRMHLISLEPEAVARLRDGLGWEPAPIEAGYFAGQESEVSALDFSDFLLVVRDDMPDDLAHLLAWCLCETRMTLERQYHHIPPERSPLSYPLEPQRMAGTSIALHAGAAEYYRGAGLIAS